MDITTTKFVLPDKEHNLKINICMSFIGILPPYIFDCVYQIRCFFNGNIFLIIDDIDSIYVKKIIKFNVFIIDYKDVKCDEFTTVFKNNIHKFADLTELPCLSGRELLFSRAIERFFLLKNLMKKLSLVNCFFMEIDNLIYNDPNEWLEMFSKKEISFMHDNENRYSSGIMYVKTHSSLDTFLSLCLEYIINTPDNVGFICEMFILGVYLNNDNLKEESKREIQILPTFWNENNCDNSYPTFSETYQLFDDFDSIFDAAGIGICLCGTESCNTYNKITFNVKSTYTSINYTSYKKTWKKDILGRKKPYIFSNSLNKWILINNLHVHSKLLNFGLSRTPIYKDIEHLSIYDEIITGERIQYLTDIYFGIDETSFSNNPNSCKTPSKYFLIKNIPNNILFDNPKICFCYTECIEELSKKIHLFKNNFILVSHNSDHNIVNCDYVNTILNHMQLKMWYSQNVSYEHPLLKPIPIGFANSKWNHGDIHTYFNNEETNRYNLERNANNKTDDFYFNFNIINNISKRYICHEKLKNSFSFIQDLEPLENLLKLSQCKYSICPEGNGEDTHRIWESLYLKTIPIVLYREHINIIIKNIDIPMIVINDWDDLNDKETISYLLKNYEIMSYNMRANAKIYMSYYRKIFDDFRKYY